MRRYPTWALGVCLGFLVMGGMSLTYGEEAPATWPQWRGPNRDGKVEGTTWPRKLSEDALKLSWRVKLGPGYSGPIVSADRVFVTETKDRAEEVVRALDRRTGKQLWQTQWRGAMTVPFFARSNGDWIRSTPAYDGECLYVAGMRDVLVCLEASTGKERWRVDFVKDFNTPLPAFGFVCSPLVDSDHLYVQAGASLVKLDKKTGKVLWRTLKDDGGMYGSAFSSPTLGIVKGRRQLLVQTRTTLAGVAPDDGKVLWSQEIPAFRGMNILTPVLHRDHVFTSSYGGKTQLLQVSDDQDTLTVSPLWSERVEGYMSTPVIIGDHAYMHLRNQRFACIDLKTGKTAWISPQSFGKYWSLVAQGEHILALDERGMLYLIKADPERFDLLDKRKISEDETWAHLAVCGSEVFVRELNGIAAYRWARPDR